MELDRRVAIATALAAAAPGDVVVIAGKGHETGQTARGRTRPVRRPGRRARRARSARVELTARRDRARHRWRRQLSGDADARATSFAIDSRVLEPGACFVALVAARDGHDFVADAVARGATVALGDPPGRASTASRSCRSTTRSTRSPALGRAARDAPARRHRRRHHGLGREDRHQGSRRRRAWRPSSHVHASPGSYNNEAGRAAHAARRADRDRGTGAGDGRARARRHRRALRDRPPHGRRDHQHRARPRRVRSVGAPAWPGPRASCSRRSTTDGLAVLDAGDPETPGLAAAHVAPAWCWSSAAERRRRRPGRATSRSTPSCARASGSSRRGVAAR